MIHHRIKPGISIRIMIKNKHSESSGKIISEIKKLGSWKIRERESTRDGYDQEIYLKLIEGNKMEREENKMDEKEKVLCYLHDFGSKPLDENFTGEIADSFNDVIGYLEEN